MNLVSRNFQRREQQLTGQLEIAFRVIGRDTTLVCPEKMDVARKGRRAAVPNFSGLGLFHDRGKKFLRDAPAGQRDAIRFAGMSGRFKFIQPRNGDSRGQFVGRSKGNQFKILHKII